ncbi:MAG: hypothetical protein KC483_05000 [Nitrosarchaeum sp.]|nr:hypothetical protein [Nitrosarchaeum sp.]MCA9819514.1 hypothetical protein [Nitrosarchaeum sp.]
MAESDEIQRHFDDLMYELLEACFEFSDEKISKPTHNLFKYTISHERR